MISRVLKHSWDTLRFFLSLEAFHLIDYRGGVFHNKFARNNLLNAWSLEVVGRDQFQKQLHEFLVSQEATPWAALHDVQEVLLVLQQSLLKPNGSHDVQVVDLAVGAVAEEGRTNVVPVIDGLTLELDGQLCLVRAAHGDLQQDHTEGEAISSCSSLQELDIHRLFGALSVIVIR